MKAPSGQTSPSADTHTHTHTHTQVCRPSPCHPEQRTLPSKGQPDARRWPELDHAKNRCSQDHYGHDPRLHRVGDICRVKPHSAIAPQLRPESSEPTAVLTTPVPGRASNSYTAFSLSGRPSPLLLSEGNSDGALRAPSLDRRDSHKKCKVPWLWVPS